MFWGWHIAGYLFFGGLSAGTFIATALLQLGHGDRYRRTVRFCSLVSLTSLIIGVLLLLTSVSQPLRAIDLLASFQNVGTSWMARGAWVLLSCGLLFMVYVLIQVVPWRRIRLPFIGSMKGIVLNVLGIVGSILAFALAAYTGILLMACTAIPAWNTCFVPALFLCSALDTGISLVMAMLKILDGNMRYWARTAWRFGVVLEGLLLCEITLLVCYAMYCNSGTCCPIAPYVPLIVLLAIAAVIECIDLWRRNTGIAVVVACAVVSLAAGFLLRMLVLQSGVHVDESIALALTWLY